MAGRRHGIDEVQRAGRCYTENDEEPEPSNRISATERLWAVANYMVTKDRCTWIAINGHDANGNKDYGRALAYPEYRLPIGAPRGARSQ